MYSLRLSAGILGVGFLLILPSCRHRVSRNFLETENLKGKVKTVTESFYPIEEKDGEMQKGKLFFKAVYSLDEKGNKISWKEFNEDGSMKWSAQSKYEDGGREVECDGYTSSGTLDWKSIYKYDEKGNRTEEEEYSANGVKNFRIVFRYDEKGVKSGREFYTADGALYSKSVYVMDAYGNEVEEQVFDGDGNLKTTNTCHYDQNDAKGNWLVQTQYANGTLAMIDEREIQYY